jgi:transcription elongation GreA/GreB family factor
MNNVSSLKQELHRRIVEILVEKIEMLQEAIFSAKESRDSDSKSSAGDKYETGRAMMHIEIAKNENQLKNILRLKNEVLKINTQKEFQQVEFGAVVHTQQGQYFIAVALGKIEVRDSSFYSISLASPLGKAMQDLTVGERFIFQDKSVEIKEIY